jgi:hypothetical protein
VIKQKNQLNTVPTETLWLTLDELRKIALAQACTPAQFSFAAEVAAIHPVRVALNLKLHSFVPASFNIPGEWPISSGAMTATSRRNVHHSM